LNQGWRALLGRVKAPRRPLEPAAAEPRH